jgi:cell division protein FtsI/penicillin-binding protein 2
MQRAAVLNPQQDILRRRLPIVIFALVVVSFALVLRLVSLQTDFLPREVVNELELQRNSAYTETLRLAAARGNILDRGMQALANNTLEYRVGISPNLVSDRARTTAILAPLLNMNELEIHEILGRRSQYVLLAPRVSAEVGHQIELLELSGDLRGMRLERVPRRSYPQGTMAAQVLGFVGGDLRGYYGVEGFYQNQLAGREANQQVSRLPFIVPEAQQQDVRGSDIVLTIDRDLQFLAESELQRALTETGANRGTIIMMNPRNGEILSMASAPSFDPNAYYNITDASVLANPALSEQYEPGSAFKVLTMAAAIEKGIISPGDTYIDQGRIEVGGIVVENWDRAAHGVVDMTQVLVQSLNVGTATISLNMGPTNFYSMMREFGIGRPTGIDLEGEIAGTMYVPGDPQWSESNLATNSFGQGVAVTPLQLITAVSAIANDGLMMQPHVFHQIIDAEGVHTSQPSALGRPISAATANIVTDMMVAVVNEGLEGNASVAGYTIAGKTGTAQIPVPGVGYSNSESIVTFVGFLPADDPQVVVLVKLERPDGYWGSQVAAPVFQRIAERLVILMKIPPDDIRHALAEAGGDVNEIDR